MTTFVWLLTFLFGLCALVFLLGAVTSSVRERRWKALGSSVLLLVVLGAATLWARSPYFAVVLELLVGAGALWLVRGNSRNADHAAQVVKLSATHGALLLGSAIFLIPFVWLLSTSLKVDDEQSSFPPIWIPTQQIRSEQLIDAQGNPAGISWYKKLGTPTAKPVKVAEMEDLPDGQIVIRVLDAPQNTNQIGRLLASREELTMIRHVAPRWQNYSDALAFLPPESHYGLTFLANTLFLTIMSTVGTLLASSVVAYAFARLQWPGKNFFFVVLLATMMIPSAVTMMPQFIIFRSLGWVDTLKPLWVPAFFGSAFHIFLLRQFFMSIPLELEDAAKIDGCSPFGIYWRIMMPQVKPALAAIGIMSVMGAWNNFQGPLIYLSSPEKMTLAYALQLYQQQHGGDPGLLMAASTMMVLPIIVLFFFAQRYFIEGGALSGLGGR